MIGTPRRAEVITISGHPKLDPVTVVFVDLATGKGMLIVECFGQAWTGSWGGMGERSTREFVRASDPSYLFSCLTPGIRRRPTKADDAYLQRICDAIFDFLHTPAY